MPLLNWLADNAPVVQAVSALAGVLVTVVLVAVTAYYAKTTAAYARIAGRQYEEGVRAREQQLRPYVHVRRPSVSHYADDPTPKGHVISLCLLNIGPGPALSVRGYLRHETEIFCYDPSLQAIDLPGSDDLSRGNVVPLRGIPITEDTRLDAVMQFPAMGSRTLSSGETRSPYLMAWIEYRDLLGHWWETRVKLGVQFDGTEPERVNLLDQSQEVRRIERPRIRQDTLQTLDELRFE